jgi:hypothetical protein
MHHNEQSEAHDIATVQTEHSYITWMCWLLRQGYEVSEELYHTLQAPSTAAMDH